MQQADFRQCQPLQSIPRHQTSLTRRKSDGLLGNRIQGNFAHDLRLPFPEGILVGIYVDDACNGFLVRDNIIDRTSSMEIYNVWPWNDTIVAESDYNLINDPKNHRAVVLEYKPVSWADWTALFDGRYEKHTVYGDPLFVDPAHDDYRLRPDSPARALGFQEIDCLQSGLRKDYQFRD